MYPLPEFEYLKPATLAEAGGVLKKQSGKARIIAGGTDLLVEMKNRSIQPQVLVDIKSLPGLSHIEWGQKEGLKIGALATINEIVISPVIREQFGILSQAAQTIGSMQVRNRGTIGGNLCNASPSSDTAPALLALGARVKIAGGTGERVIPLEEFFMGPGQTVLQPGEILTEILLPPPVPHTAGAYLKLGIRKAMEIALVNVGVVVSLDKRGGICREVKIALGAVAPTPIRSKKAEAALRGKPLVDEWITQAAQRASEEARPISDLRGSAEYRREMVRVLVQRAIDEVKNKLSES